jgi:hypothetical protein
MKFIKKKGIKKIHKKLQAEIRGGLAEGPCEYLGYSCDEYHIIIDETGGGECSATSLTRIIHP